MGREGEVGGLLWAGDRIRRARRCLTQGREVRVRYWVSGIREQGRGRGVRNWAVIWAARKFWRLGKIIVENLGC